MDADIAGTGWRLIFLINVPVGIAGLVLVGIGQALGVGSLFRLVRSEVSVHAAGVGSGVLVTARQAAMSIGVAGLGSLFTGLAAQGTMLHAVVVIPAVQTGITLILVAVSRLLPRIAR